MATKTSTRSTKSTSKSAETERSSTGTGVNRVTLVGRVVAIPELRTTGSGIPVTTVRIATNDREKPEFHDVVLWRQHAEFAANYMATGRLAYVEGRLQSHTWEAADGSRRRSVEVVADRFQALSARQAAEATA
jgi:single-strand DNA-binding protein